MGIKLRKAKPLRVVSVTCDDAIDEEATPMDEYLKTRDPDLIKLLPGASADFFVLRPLRPSVIAAVDESSGQMPAVSAFAFALQECSNPDIQKRLVFEGSGDTRHVEQKCLDDLFPLDLMIELGGVAHRMASLTEGEGSRFAAPDGWQQIRRLQLGSNVSSAVASEARTATDSSAAKLPATS